MIIVIDYRLAATSNRGMARYCREIVNELFSLDNHNEYYLLCNTIPRDVVLPQNFRFEIVNSKNFILGEQIFIPYLLRKIKPDIYWATANTFPIFISRKIKLFVTIHDLIFFHKPIGRESLYKSIGRLYRKFIVKYFFKKINVCFTVSEYSKALINNTFHIKNKILVTYNCLSKKFVDLAKTKLTEKKENFYFTCSGDSPSKNLSFLINVFKTKLPNEKLYIAGVSDDSVIRLQGDNNIIFLSGKMTDLEIIEKYTKCKAFIFPSLEEGFGIPILEALCCKAKVIASNRTSIPEVLADNGILFDPLSEDDFIEKFNMQKSFPFKFDYSKYISWIKTAEIVYISFSEETS